MRRAIACFVTVVLASVCSLAHALCPHQCPEPGTWVPWYGNSTVPSLIRVAGFGADGVLDPLSEVTIVVRDLANNPLAGALVSFDFSGCAPATICAVSSSTCHELDVPNQRVHTVTDANGVVTLRFAGTANNPGGAPALGDELVELFVCGTLLASRPAVFFDMNGGDGVGAGDLSAWLTDFNMISIWLRGDYDGNGALGANDLSLWLTAAGTGRSALGCQQMP